MRIAFSGDASTAGAHGQVLSHDIVVARMRLVACGHCGQPTSRAGICNVCVNAHAPLPEGYEPPTYTLTTAGGTEMSRADDPKITTTTGKPASIEDGPAPEPIDPVTRQHGAYWVLTEEERGKGFVRPVRDSYTHSKCGSLTKMGRALAETYAREPSFYGSTFCVKCRAHFPVSEFLWDRTQETVGS